MTKTGIGALFIVAGAAYGSMAIDKVYELTLGNLMKYNLIRPPTKEQQKEIKSIRESAWGRKGTIFTYAAGLIAVGAYLIIAPKF